MSILYPWGETTTPRDTTIEVDGIVSTDPLYNHRTGAVTYDSDPVTGEIITILSGRMAVEAVLSTMFRELNGIENPSPENDDKRKPA